ncbi:hypothetical protein BLS_006546 [Venturia inaequalis]|uniref:DUF7580 domain-containing protein n=1 Tax=Venturia inaequalis TaxID=5025 RepID=A0A8H3Z396_VENIN|nr:hypothetical protein BLS_006546 [Venturia inaequalis]KAE9984205.1 hypothetical protein EG327_005221 [Venturia inaequalis]
MVHLEALGLGLGIAPLIAELLKANPEPVNAFKALDPKYITESRQEFYRDLAFEVTMLKMTLTSLVRELPITDEEKSKLVDDKNLDVMVWKKPSEELRSALEGRLSSCSDTFIQSMERILQLFGRIVEDKSVPLSANQIKLRIGWTKEKRDRILQGLQKHNQRLVRMLKRSSSIAARFLPPQRKFTGRGVPDLGLRRLMSGLRKSIGSAWCKCTGKHEAQLGLQKTWKKEDHVRLDLLLNVSQDTGKVQWGESKINIYLKDPAEQTLEEKRKGRRPSESHRQVDHICETVRAAQKVRRASQITFHENILWHDTTTTENEIPPQFSHRRGASLDQVLKSRKLKMKDRKILQVLLAQSVLFFPWSAQDLNKFSISLHHDLSKPFAPLAPDHGHGRENPSPNSSVDEENQPVWKPYDNEILAALATTLLEIELEEPIEKMQKEDDLGDCGPGTFDANFWTTTRIMSEKEDDMLQGCYKAIDACLRCDFEGHERTLDDPSVLQQVYERIVAPLERDLLTGFGIEMPFGAPDAAKECSGTTVTISLPPVVATPANTHRTRRSVTTSRAVQLDEKSEDEDIFGGDFSDVTGPDVHSTSAGVSAITI